MSCISSNFSSFFLNSLNDASEFAKYLSNGELKFSPFEDFQVFSSGSSSTPALQQQQQQQQQQQYSSPQQQQQQQQQLNVSNVGTLGAIAAGVQSSNEMFNNVAHMEANTYTHASAAAAASLHHQAHSQTHAPPQHHQQQAHPHHTPHHPHYATPLPPTLGAGSFPHHHHQLAAANAMLPNNNIPPTPTTPQGYPIQRWPTAIATGAAATTPAMHSHNHPGAPHAHAAHTGAHFDGSFEFIKYLRHSNDYTETNENAAAAASNACATSTAPGTPAAAAAAAAASQQAASLIDLDSSTSQKSRSSRKVAALLSSVTRASSSLDAAALDVFDHDSKHTIFDINGIANSNNNNSSNSNESSLEMTNLAFPSSHLNASNSNTSSEGAAAGSSDFSMLGTPASSGAPKTLATFTMKENFDVHPSHKVEEGIFQHMNKLPSKKKDNLKQLGVRFTGQMTLNDKLIIVDNFIKFCQEYDIQDHRPFLSLNQSGLNKPEQIKFARYLGQGLPTFTLFCIYSNFKNLFCTKRIEIYTKDGYNLPYILDKTKRSLLNTNAGEKDDKKIKEKQPNATQPPNTQTPSSQPANTQMQEQQPLQAQQQQHPLPHATPPLQAQQPQHITHPPLPLQQHALAPATPPTLQQLQIQQQHQMPQQQLTHLPHQQQQQQIPPQISQQQHQQLATQHLSQEQQQQLLQHQQQHHQQLQHHHQQQQAHQQQHLQAQAQQQQTLTPTRTIMGPAI